VESLIWAVIGLLLILAEFAVPQFVVFFFGLGALVNALLVPLVPGLSRNIPLQLVLWAITSGISLGLLRKYAARWFRGDNAGGRNDADVGLTATVLVEITPEIPGRISLHGTSWRAITIDETIPAGSTVTILGKENLSYTVTAGDLLADSRSDKEYT
jgi:membrane protein implicated in regulation of membrane protease activity